jgi:hypothetical protein
MVWYVDRPLAVVESRHVQLYSSHVAAKRNTAFQIGHRERTRRCARPVDRVTRYVGLGL